MLVPTGNEFNCKHSIALVLKMQETGSCVGSAWVSKVHLHKNEMQRYGPNLVLARHCGCIYEIPLSFMHSSTEGHPMEKALGTDKGYAVTTVDNNYHSCFAAQRPLHTGF